MWKNRASDGISINYSEIALTDFRTNGSIGNRVCRDALSKIIRHLMTKGTIDQTFSDGFDMEEADDVSVFLRNIGSRKVSLEFAIPYK